MPTQRDMLSPADGLVPPFPKLRSLADIEAVESVPLRTRLGSAIITDRIRAGLSLRDPDDIGLYYIEDGDCATAPLTFTFGELRNQIDAVSRLLRSMGVGRTDVVALVMPAVPALYWALIGAMTAGIAFPINWMMRPSELLALIDQSRAKVIIALGPTPGFEIWESLTSIRAQVPDAVQWLSVSAPGHAKLPDTDLEQLAQRHARPGAEAVTAAGSGHEIAAYLHSGGTTGMPKVFQASHLNLSYRQWAGEYSLALTSDETVFWDLPLFHSGGLCGRFLPALGCGCSFVIPSIMGARDKKFVSQYWRFVERYRITRISGVPTTLSVLAKHPPRSEDVSCLKPYSPTGSTSMPSAVREEFQRTTGVRILVTYGLTENLANATMDPRDGPIKWGSSGIRLPYTHLRTVIVDNRHQWVRDCACDEIGEIWVRGPGVSPGTIGRDGVTVPLDTDGWLSTGDLGRLDGEGYLTVTGRAKDVIIRGGHNISPALIEEPLQASPDVLHAAAVGKLDAYAGEIPVAYVELVPGSRATSADLLHFVQPRIGERAALPKEIYILDKMPLSTVGKPLKIALRADAAVRTLRADLACRLGFSPADDRLEIEVVPHALFGSQAVIHVHCTSAHEQEQYREIATEAMGHYAVSFTVAVNVTGAAKAS